jgi:hypothetical protein
MDGAATETYASAMSVFMKSSPLKRSGRLSVAARAYEEQSPG